MSDRAKLYINGKPAGEVKSVDIQLDLPTAMASAAESFRRFNEALWRVRLDQEFGPT